MAVCARLQPLFLGCVGFSSVIMLALYHLDMLQGNTEIIHQLQEQRKQHLREMCESVKEEFPEWKRSAEAMSNGELHHILVNDNHGVLYCYIPKVACSNWKRFMLFLEHGEPYRDPMSFGVHGNPLIKFLKGNPIEMSKAKLKHYTKFLFVRDPFVRLISAYRNKLQKYVPSFYESYGQLILKRFGNQSNPAETKDKTLASRVFPSFHNFIQFLIDPNTRKPFNEHWSPMYQLCHPCLIKYDFIGHQETLSEDAEHLLRILKLGNGIKLSPAYQNVTTKDYLLAWYKPVPLEDRKKLYQLYEMDFKLFGYPKPVELLDG
ncbi:carbohydrate sulfotransferase 12-like [Brachionichthys hirsutus]|uniref:carbohydrate sulfotransferase 12-like n=1 Tax=Brachionichthys hirsutus TaxID=412623 RepID=UPI00360536DD